MGIIEELSSLRADVDGLRRALGRHTRVPELRWGTVTALTPEIRVGWPEGGDCVITQSSEAVWVGAQVQVQVQGKDRWIIGVAPHARALTGASDLNTTILEGSYSWTGSPANLPAGAGTAGWLEVLSPNGVTQQRASDPSGHTWVRSLAASVWSAWVSTSGWTQLTTFVWPSYFGAYGTNQVPTFWALGPLRRIHAGTFEIQASWAANTAYTGAWGPAVGDRPLAPTETGCLVRLNATIQAHAVIQLGSGAMTWFTNIGGTPGSSAIDVPDMTWTTV
ncbi:pyocin knob domain-containing protein [Tessaracoccus sp.]